MLPLGIVQQQPTGPIVLFHDDMEGPGSELITARTPNIDVIGGGWLASGNTPQMHSGNYATTGSYNVYHRAFADVNTPDVVITGYLWNHKVSSASVARAILRYQDTSNYWHFGVWTFTTSPWTYGIWEVNGGTNTLRASAQGTTVANEIGWAFTVTANGDSLRLEIPTESIDLSYSSSFLNDKTKHGFSLYRSGGTTYTPRCYEFQVEG